MTISASGSALKSAYPDAPVRLRHGVAGRPLFTMDRLLQLAKELPGDCVEYNSGDLPLGQDPALTPQTGLSVEETIRRIAQHQSWLVLKNVEKAPPYGALMNDCLQVIEPIVTDQTGPMHNKQAYIFISSPHSVTPFHMDPEHNILLQIEGGKSIQIYNEHVVAEIPPEHHEAFHAGLGHRNLRHLDRYEAEKQVSNLTPGDAIYVPVKAPHSVINGDAVSISFSITWRSRLSDREATLHLANRKLRQWGASPSRPGARPTADALKIWAFKGATRLGFGHK